MDHSFAILTKDGRYTKFIYNGKTITFMHGKDLIKYLRVKEWDNGYLVVDVDYSTLGETEEYVDITSILNNLYIDAQSFLKPIKGVLVDHV